MLIKGTFCVDRIRRFFGFINMVEILSLIFFRLGRLVFWLVI